MTAEEFESRIGEWASRHPDVEALIQIGSRADPAAQVDAWSDWDFYLITSRPGIFQPGPWLQEIAHPWCARTERTPRGVTKLSVVFEGGREADFVLLKPWQLKLVFWAMRRPGWARAFPMRLRRGIVDARAFLRASGTRVLAGGAAWQRRLEALSAEWPDAIFTAEEFRRNTDAFWQRAVWICKRVARSESRAAMHALHSLAIDHVYVMLAEEARLEGRPSRGEARKAEQWLLRHRLEQTDMSTRADQSMLARALLGQLELFEDVSRSVAESRGFTAADYTAVAAWVRAVLGGLAAPLDGIRPPETRS